MNESHYAVALTDFRSLRMGRMYEQQDALDYTAWLLAVAQTNGTERGGRGRDPGEQLFEHYREQVGRYGVSPSMIARRQMSTFPERCAPDEHDRAPDFPALFSSAHDRWQPPGLHDRMDYFRSLAVACFERFYADDDSPPDDLIHVSCAGYLSPSPAQQYVSKRAWYGTGVIHSYHMGCYGAFPPVQMATGFLFIVLLVATPKNTSRHRSHRATVHACRLQ